MHQQTDMARVTAYVDGFNLYHGIRAGGRGHLWLDLDALAVSLLKPHQRLSLIRYFTAHVRDDPGGQQRQATYLDALVTHSPRVEVIRGRFQEKSQGCRECGARWRIYQEKETDVSIAVSLVEDGVANRFDTALVISADSDLCPAIRTLARLRPDKRVIAAFPPRRHSNELRRTATGVVPIGADKIRRALLPEVVVTETGIVLTRPKTWC